MKTKLEAMLTAYRNGDRGPIEYHDLANLLVEEGDGQVYLNAVDAAAADVTRGDKQRGSAEFDAALLGVGYLVDGVHVHPSRVTVFTASPVQPVAVPDGWALIPIDPTDAMLSAIAGTRYEQLHPSKQKAERDAYTKLLLSGAVFAATAAKATS